MFRRKWAMVRDLTSWNQTQRVEGAGEGQAARPRRLPIIQPTRRKPFGQRELHSNIWGFRLFSRRGITRSQNRSYFGRVGRVSETGVSNSARTPHPGRAERLRGRIGSIVWELSPDASFEANRGGPVPVSHRLRIDQPDPSARVIRKRSPKSGMMGTSRSTRTSGSTILERWL